MAKLTETVARNEPALEGEVRIYHAKSKQTGEVVKTIEVARTNRPYVYDLCDAYNRNLPDSMVDAGKAWFVDGSGNLQIGRDLAAIEADVRRQQDRDEAERKRHARNLRAATDREAA